MISLKKSFSDTPFKIDFWAKSEDPGQDQNVKNGLLYKKAQASSEEDRVKERKKEIELSYDQLSEYYKDFYLGFLKQVHGDRCILVCQNTEKQGSFFWEEADAAFSFDCKIALCVRAADCVPIIFYIKKRGENIETNIESRLSSNTDILFGVIHAGWRGLKANILSKTIDRIKEQIPTLNVKRLHFRVGPYIGCDSYEVGEDVFSLFPSWAWSDKPPQNSAPSVPKSDKKMLNLKSILEDQFKNLSIDSAQIIWDNRDTYLSHDIYSHRRGEIGRNITVIHQISE